MSLVFAGITPHPPLLIPDVGKEAMEKVDKTKSALEMLEQELYLSKPDAVIIISPHGSFFEDAFSVNGHTILLSTFETFGDMSTKKEWRGNPEMAARLSHNAKMKHLPIRVVSQEHVDHGVSVPLFYLMNHLQDRPVLPIGFSGLSPKEHLEFGGIIKELIMDSEKRVAVIASADLSHALTTDAPSGFHKSAKTFDANIQELLQTKNTTGFVTLDAQLVKDADECGYRSILILLGILKNMDYSFKHLCYEAPHGVGYLTGQFVF